VECEFMIFQCNAAAGNRAKRPEDAESQLQKLSRDGWKVISCTPTFDLSGEIMLVSVLQRPVK